MQKLHPKAIYLFWFQDSVYFLFILGGLWIATFFFRGEFSSLERALLDSGIFGVLLLSIVITHILARLTYYFYKYELAEDGLRIEKGIIWKKYTYIPYERVQNINIDRGLIARMLGLSEIYIQTAGYGLTSSSIYAEGKLPGLSIEDAEKLRQELLRKVKGTKEGL